VTFSEVAAKAWCLGLVRSLDMDCITRDGLPYLNRYYLAGWSPRNRRSGPAVFLHHFVASDANESVHSHPWGWSASLILAGGYREERCDPNGNRQVLEYRPGDVNVLEPDDKHRIDLIGPECWTLFLAGNFQKAWAFTPRCE
jgi:hypothetical protein